MGNGNIQDAVKFLTGIWRDAGKNVSAEETRKWIQPHVETVSRIMADKDAAATLGKIVADVFPDGNWQSAVALNQILFLGRLNERPEKAKDILAKFYEVWNKQPLNLSAFLVEWRKQTVGSNLDPEIILNTIEYDASKQSYFDPDLSKTGADFFTNMYKEELGVDINALADAAARIVGEEHVEDFFRLVDIDAPMAPEEFVKRVEKAIDVLAAAKEQGLDIKMVFRKWDELADQGGERMVKLAAAVKAVAERAVRERFWEEFMKRAGSLKVPVIDDNTDPSDLLSMLHDIGLVKIKGDGIEIEKDVDTILANALEILLKTNPSAMYTTSDLVAILEEILRAAKDKKSVINGSSVLAQLNVITLRQIVNEGRIPEIIDVSSEIMAHGGVKPEEMAEAIRMALAEGKGEDLKQAVMTKLHVVKER